MTQHPTGAHGEGPDLPDRFVGTEPDPVPDGGILTVAFDDPERGGHEITVTAADGDDPTDQRTLTVALRGNGRGRAQLIVPVGWGSVHLSAEGTSPHSVGIALPP